jgi:hypothetical protein
VVAQHFGIRVVDITFWPLGGMARMSQIPEDSRVEGWIAVAGPLVNFALAALTVPLLLVPPIAPFATYFVAANLVLGTFNLVPAFPMDGGRVLRAWLGRRGDWLGATEEAVRVGRFVALAMVVAGFAWNPVLLLIAVFVWWAGGQELATVRMRHMGAPAFGFGPLRAIFEQAAAAGQAQARAQHQAPPREPRAATVDPGPAAPPRRPVGPDAPEGRGWSEQDLERLERFPGPLRQFRPE